MEQTQTSMQAPTKMKFAIIGMGFIYPRHVQAIKAIGGEIILNCDIDPTKNPDFTDWLEMFHHPRFQEVTHVVVCTPNYLHAVIAREALLRNKEVLCEKPLSINGSDGLEGVSTVLQLRYAPKILELKNTIGHPKHVQVVAKMFRDDKYWNSWKGNAVKSGGTLYNLGIHYLDLAIFLLGDNFTVADAEITEKKVDALVNFQGVPVEFLIEILDDREGQERYIKIDDQRIELSNKDNLSYEDLHQQVYQNFIYGSGISVVESRKSLDLAHAILNFIKRT